ncbi:MAG: CARDB domain-containing protein, partial [Anaerolineae bacterium]
NIWYDTGPPTYQGIADPTLVVVGNRVIIDLRYDAEFITPMMQVFAPRFPIHVIARRTIQRVHIIQTPTPGPPTFTPTPTTTPTPGPSPTPTPPRPTPTPPPTATPTQTPIPSPTLTPTPTPRPIVIFKPLLAGQTVVTGTAEPGRQLLLRNIQTGFQMETLVGADGRFTFSLQTPLVAGHTIVVQGYGTQDIAVVQPMGTSTPTPTPTGPVMTASPACMPEGNRSVSVRGERWPTGGNIKQIGIFWDSTRVRTISPAASSFIVTFTVSATLGNHSVLARTEKSNGNPTGDVSLTQSITVPCQGQFPNLIIPSLTLADPEPLGTHQTVRVHVTLQNTGTVDIASLFWVDLYADPQLDTPLDQQTSVDWVAVNGLSAGSSITFTMWVPGGFDTVGSHTLLAVADTWHQIAEGDETDNASAVLTVTVLVQNPVPTPTPTPTPTTTPIAPGGISGTTYVRGVGLSGVDVYLYDPQGRLVASTRSGSGGAYSFSNLSPGDYALVAQVRLGDTLYRGTNVATVYPGTITTGVDIILTY